MSEWISIKDRLPQINTSVLVYTNEYGVCIDFYTIDYNNPKKHFFAYRGNRVIYWMPLPEPPKEETDDAELVKHGHWIKEKYKRPICSVCGNTGFLSIIDSITGDFPYCAWCGAKMDERIMEK